jgi:uncharacterized protein
MNAIWNHFGGFGKLLAFTLLVFVSFTALSLLALLAALPFVGGFSLSGSSTVHMSIGMLRYFQIVQSFSVFIIPSLLAGLLFWGHLTRGIRLHSSARGLLILLSVFIIVSSQPLVSWLGIWNSSIEFPEFLNGIERWMRSSEDNAGDLIYRFLNTDSWSILLLNFLMIAILPAIGEEMLFRGVLQPIFYEWTKNKHLAVFITAFLFSAIHLQFFTFLPRFFLGIVLGYLIVWGKNLWYSVAGHFSNNFLSLIIFYYYRYTNPKINPLEPNMDAPSFIWVFLATPLMVLFFYRFILSGEKEQ